MRRRSGLSRIRVTGPLEGGKVDSVFSIFCRGEANFESSWGGVLNKSMNLKNWWVSRVVRSRP